MILSQAIGEFLLARRTDGRAKKTLSWYEFALARFDKLYGHIHINMITTKQIRAYLSEEVDRTDRGEISEETLKGLKRGLHGFWQWAAIEYHIVNPMENIRIQANPISGI